MKARLHSDSGQAFIWFALSLVVLLGIAALAVDVGRLYGERRRMQNAADAAALAGAHEMCQGRPDADAIAMANDYAIARNGAQWATPEPFGAGTLDRGMDVTAGKSVNNLFAVFLNANSTVVSAHAKAVCEKTQTGCATWPLGLDMDKFTAMSCGESFVISLDQQGYGSTCPSGCDCSHIFTWQSDAAAQVGWINNDAALEVGQCVVDRIGMNGSTLVDWYGNVPVRIPLFNGKCSGGYNIAGFGCFVLTSPPYEPQGTMPNCDTPIGEVINAKVDCNCTISCGSAGGRPGLTDATIPVLVR
jgi:Flp pilus assembly protein TadG